MPGRRTRRCTAIALVCLLALCASAATAHAAKPRKTIGRELTKLYERGSIDQATYDADLRDPRATSSARSAASTGARKLELAGALATVEADGGARRAARLAAAAALPHARAQPRVVVGAAAADLGPARHVRGLRARLAVRSRPGPAAPPARELRQAQRVRQEPRPADPRTRSCSTSCWRSRCRAAAGSRGSTTSTSAAASRRGCRASRRAPGCRRSPARPRSSGGWPSCCRRSRRGSTLFEQAPPTGVRVETEEGAHYLQYSYWPDLRVLNGFVQSLVGLYDVAKITGDPRAAQLFADGDRAAKAEVPQFDTGAWSLYSRDAITRESDLHYHTLLRDFLTSLCDRTAEPVYCTAESHFTGYLTTPPVLELRTTRLRGGKRRTLRFSLSKISSATVRVVAPSGRTVLATAAGTVGRGTRSVAWKVPRRAGDYRRPIDATDLAGNVAQRRGPRRGAASRSAASGARSRLRGRRWPRARSSTRARAASARRPSPPPPRAAARRPGCARSCSRPIPRTRSPTCSSCRSAPSRPSSGRTCGRSRCRRRTSSSATGRPCRAGSARCWSSAASSGSPPRS